MSDYLPARIESKRGRGACKPTPDPKVVFLWRRNERARKDGFLVWLQERYAMALRTPDAGMLR